MKRASFFVVCCMLLLMVSGCALEPTLDEGSKGGLLFDFDLSYPKALGYDITQVQVTLTHSVSGREVVADLDVDSVNNTASGLVRNLRPGVWNILVELYEGDTLMGEGTSSVTITTGITKQVWVHITLASGSVEVIVDWGEETGPSISFGEFDNDFGEVLVGSSSEPRELTIYNTGTEDLYISDISLLDITNFSLDLNGGTKPLGSATAVIPPGGKGTLTVTFTPQTTGTHTVNLQIGLNIVGTPTLHLPWTAVGRPQFIVMPNLAPVNFTSPGVAQAGDAIGASVTVSVINSLGVANAADGAITVAFYLSNDWVWSSGDVLLTNGRVDVATPIQYNETKPVPVPSTLAIPAGTPVGTYYLLAVVDADEEVFENTETNNVDSEPIAIMSGISVSGTLEVGVVGELGNYFDVSFSSVQSVTLVDVSWDWTGHNVWVDRYGGSNVLDPEYTGVTNWTYHWGDPPSPTPPDYDYQIFGYSATGFDSGDYLRITADLDRDASGGTPLYDDYYGGTVKLRFSDGTTIVALYTTAVPDNPFAARAVFNASAFAE